MKTISFIYEDNKISYMIADKKDSGEIEILQGLKIIEFKTDDRNKAITMCTGLMKENDCDFMIYEDYYETIFINKSEVD